MSDTTDSALLFEAKQKYAEVSAQHGWRPVYSLAIHQPTSHGRITRLLEPAPIEPSWPSEWLHWWLHL